MFLERKLKVRFRMKTSTNWLLKHPILYIYVGMLVSLSKMLVTAELFLKPDFKKLVLDGFLSR